MGSHFLAKLLRAVGIWNRPACITSHLRRWIRSEDGWTGYEKHKLKENVWHTVCAEQHCRFTYSSYAALENFGLVIEAFGRMFNNKTDEITQNPTGSGRRVVPLTWSSVPYPRSEHYINSTMKSSCSPTREKYPILVSSSKLYHSAQKWKITIFVSFGWLSYSRRVQWPGLKLFVGRVMLSISTEVKCTYVRLWARIFIARHSL